MAPGALAGLRVLDISTFLAAPQITAILGDFGADVIKLEPPGGDGSRKIGAQRNGESLMWALASRNKRTITLDLNKPEGQELLRSLIANVDVLVENYPAATLEKWGCSWEHLSAINPKLVMASVSCYGRTGPLSALPGAGTLAEAYAGLTHMTGEADGAPMLPSIPLGDTLTGIAGVVGVLAACYHRDVNGGSGQHVDVTMFEPVLTLMHSTIIAYDPTSDGPPPGRFGSRIPTGVPRNVYRAGDGRWLVLSGTTDPQVGRILSIIGHDTDDDRARFARSTDRIANADALDGLVAEWIGQHPLNEVLQIMSDNRIPVAPVNDVPAILADEHMRARGDIVVVHDEVMGDINMVAPSPQLSATPGIIRFPGAPVGAHNSDVYGELLGFDAARLERLHAAGII